MPVSKVLKDQGLGVDVIITDIEKNPCCTHGPTVLFERFQSNGTSCQYFACSACRDRRDCPYYHVADQKISQAKEELWQTLINEAAPKIPHKNLYTRFKSVRALPGLQRAYCVTCSQLLGSKRTGHDSCDLKFPIFDSHLYQPSQFLPPKDSARFEAQFLFSPSCVNVILGMLDQLEAKKVLCIGAPRIFEAITSSPKKDKTGLLMDIDTRYASFFPPSQYIHYNMFNHHFFDGDEAKQVYQQFLKGEEKLVLVSDPPFGGRMELLAHNIKKIEKEWKEANGLPKESQLSVFFIFPYFNEPQVLEPLPNFVMLDYQVDYDNHPLYSSGTKGMTFGSPVRVYVNDRPSLFSLPESKGYRFCKPCDRWVRSSNTHCGKCKGCMSKDGRTYQHCDICQKCVKPMWKHCSKCLKCHPREHKCGDAGGEAKSFTCHCCGKEGHKRADCTERKRSLEAPESDLKPKKQRTANDVVGLKNKKKNRKMVQMAEKENKVKVEAKNKVNVTGEKNNGKQKNEVVMKIKVTPVKFNRKQKNFANKKRNSMSPGKNIGKNANTNVQGNKGKNSPGKNIGKNANTNVQGNKGKNSNKKGNMDEKKGKQKNPFAKKMNKAKN